MASYAMLAVGLTCLGITSDYDPIHAVVARIRANPVWGNGVERVYSLSAEATDSQILAAAYPTISFPGKTRTYLILEEETVQIPYSARAILVRGGAQEEVWILRCGAGGWTVDLAASGLPGHVT